MSLTYGVGGNVHEFCQLFGSTLLELSNDTILNEAIRVSMNGEYTTEQFINKINRPRTRFAYNNGYIWPADFDNRVLNLQSSFCRKYHLNIYEPFNVYGIWIVGHNFIPKGQVKLKDIQIATQSERYDIEVLLSKILTRPFQCNMYISPPRVGYSISMDDPDRLEIEIDPELPEDEQDLADSYDSDEDYHSYYLSRLYHLYFE